MKRAVSFFLALVLCLACGASAFASGVAPQSRAVLGGNLTADQIAQVYQAFGIQRGSVIELTITNAEERAYLQGYVSEELIGTRSISSVYVELRQSGGSLDVTTSNISWCSPQMYMSALATAGVTDARVIVAAPFEVSGTAALAGIFKAYEDMTGRKLDAQAKAVGTQELSVTGELGAAIGGLNSASIVNELKLMLSETARMTDDELREQIVQVASRYRVKLTDKQVNQLLLLCRSLEKLDAKSLRSRVEEVQQALGKVSEAKTQVVGFFQRLEQALDSIISFFDRLGSLFDW